MTFETPILVLLGGATIGGLAWIAKILGERVIKKFFDQAEELEEKKESMLNERIKWLSASVDDLKKTIKENTQESTKHKIMMQGLSHELSTLRTELKDGNSNHKDTIVRLIEILKSMQGDIKFQRQEIETIGRVIMRLPEEK